MPLEYVSHWCFTLFFLACFDLYLLRILIVDRGIYSSGLMRCRDSQGKVSGGLLTTRGAHSNQNPPRAQKSTRHTLYYFC